MARRHNDSEGEARTEKLAFLAEASLTELTTQGAGVRQKCNQDRKTSHEAEIKGKKNTLASSSWLTPPVELSRSCV